MLEDGRGWERNGRGCWRMGEEWERMLEDARGCIISPIPAVSKQEIRNFAGWAQTDLFFFPIWGRRAQAGASLTYY